MNKRLIAWAVVGLTLGAVPMSAQQIGLPQTITVVDSGTACSVAGTCAAFAVSAVPSATIDVSGTWTGTISFEGIGGGSYNAVLVTNLATGALVSSTTANGTFAIPNTGLVSIRARATASMTGTALVASTRGFLSAKYLTVPFGGGSGSYTPSGVVFVSTTSASNVSTAETTLITFPLPANSLSVNGKGVRVTVWGTLAANGNTKTYKLYFGATAVNSHSTTTSGGAWLAQYIVLRTGATSQIGYDVTSQVGTAQQGGVASTPAETLSGAVTIRVTGQSGTGSNDITALAMIVEALP